MNKKNTLLMNAAIMGLFVAGGVTTANADNHTPTTKKECKAADGKWAKGSCTVEKAGESSCGESSCKGESSCGEGSCKGEKSK